MRLFGFSYSPFVAKVRKCLELKGLPFSYVEVPYLDRRELLALTGGSIHVPVLEDAGTVVSDSARITAWLDCKYGPNLRSDPLAVLVEAWADNVLEDTVFRINLEAAREEISLIKVTVAGTLQRVLDRAIQTLGALGMTDDTPLAFWWAHERAGRIYDGADEVHIASVAKRILSAYAKGRGGA